jgi:hypothetical protein
LPNLAAQPAIDSVASTKVVLRGLVPRIHAFLSGAEGVDGRAKPGQSEIREPIPFQQARGLWNAAQSTIGSVASTTLFWDISAPIP